MRKYFVFIGLAVVFMLLGLSHYAISWQTFPNGPYLFQDEVTFQHPATFQDTATFSGATSFAGDSTLSGDLSVGDNLIFPTATIASNGTVTLGDGVFFTLTGTTPVTDMTAGTAGRIVVFQMASGCNMTDGNNLVMAGDLVGTSNDMISFVSNGTVWLETSRSVN